MPEQTLLAFADHGRMRGVLPGDGGDAKEALARFARAGVHDAELGDRLQREGAEAFSASWRDPMGCLAAKAGFVTH
jgi:transaldolase